MKVKQFRKLLTKQGFECVDNGKGFWVRQAGCSGQVQIHNTPSDHRWLKNSVRDMTNVGMQTDALKRALR